MIKTNLQELRKQAGFKSANAFADHMGIARATYTGYEQGRTLTLDQAWEFADYFGCSLDELIGRDWPRNENVTDISSDEQLVLNAMGNVTPEGRARIVEDATLIAESPRYTKNEDVEDSGIQTA